MALRRAERRLEGKHKPDQIRLTARAGLLDAIVNGRMDFAEPQRLAAFCAD